MVIPSSQRGHYIVGVDFGTTFSCVIFAYSSSGGADEDTKLVQEWPGYSADDVPSLLHYSSVASSEYDWGFQIKRGVRNAPQPLAWFKLLLQHEDGVIPSTHTAASSAHTPPPDSPTPNASPNPDSMVSLFEQFMLASPEGHRAVLDQRLPDPRWNESAADTGASPAQLTKQMLDGLGITADRVVTDYLTALRVHAYEVICRNYGRESVESCRVKYVLTIPAIWSDRAKNRMVRAVSDAGYGVHRQDFHLIGEPEAAAAYVLRTLQPNHLSVGDTFVICDAGGGTVDLISYKIKTLNPLTIDEVVPGTGDLCGSVFLDNRFEAALRAKLGAAFDGLTQKRKSEIMANWDLWVKQPFGNQAPDQDYFDMTAHGLPQFQDDDIDIDEESELRMTLKFIKEMFEPTVSRIIELIDGQVEGAACKGLTVNAILLVGGLGTSQYLFERIQNHAFQGRNIVVMKPGQGKSAIARGALMRGLDGSIVTERRYEGFGIPLFQQTNSLSRFTC
ncbi:hypothetical protein EDC01DRAFT_506796 [Geopyxis carbonaria]|nr:hypothetical protein EDC01DRAFT_506796 [Geopyxis carbonaria]